MILFKVTTVQAQGYFEIICESKDYGKVLNLLENSKIEYYQVLISGNECDPGNEYLKVRRNDNQIKFLK